MVALTECEVAGCDRPRMNKFPLCKWHRHCQRQGRNPHEVSKRFTYGTDDTCKIAGCSEKPVANWLCKSHHSNRNYKTKEELLMDEPQWSKVCWKCHKAKSWDKFIRASDIPNATCLECFRKMQKGEDEKKKTYDIQAALAEIHRLATGLHEDS
jgi:hypothetical protein